MGISFLADICVVLNQIHSDLPEVLHMSLLFPGRNLKTFRGYLAPHFSPTKTKGEKF